MRPEHRRPERSLHAAACPARALLAILAAAPLQVLAFTSLSVLTLAPPQDLAAQRGTLLRDSLTALGPGIGEIPFHPGEELKFRVNASIFGSGEAVMKVGQPDTIHGVSTLPLEFRIQGSLMGGAHKLDDKFHSWIDPEKLISRRFHKITDHGRRIREYEFFPEDGRVQRIDHDTAWALPSTLPLDDLSFVHFARTLPLEVGESYTYNRYFKEAGNPVIIEVLRKDQVETKAGVFNTIVVRPIIPGSSLFEKGARAEIHFSDDARRLVVYMRLTKFWIVPLTMELTEYTTGVPSEPGDPVGPAQPREGEQPVGERPAKPEAITVGGKVDERR